MLNSKDLAKRRNIACQAAYLISLIDRGLYFQGFTLGQGMEESHYPKKIIYPPPPPNKKSAKSKGLQSLPSGFLTLAYYNFTTRTDIKNLALHSISHLSETVQMK